MRMALGLCQAAQPSYRVSRVAAMTPLGWVFESREEDELARRISEGILMGRKVNELRVERVYLGKWALAY